MKRVSDTSRKDDLRTRCGTLVAVLLVTALAVGCGAGDSGTAGSGDEVETLPVSVRAPEVENGILIVSPDEVRKWLDDERLFVLVDARDAAQFRQEHLPGAVNVPYVDIRPGAALPPRDRPVVVYCSDANCPISQYAYESLQQLGYTDVYDMRDGLQGWKAAGFATVIEDIEAITPADSDESEGSGP